MKVALLFSISTVLISSGRTNYWLFYFLNMLIFYCSQWFEMLHIQMCGWFVWWLRRGWGDWLWSRCLLLFQVSSKKRDQLQWPFLCQSLPRYIWQSHHWRSWAMYVYLSFVILLLVDCYRNFQGRAEQRIALTIMVSREENARDSRIATNAAATQICMF